MNLSLAPTLPFLMAARQADALAPQRRIREEAGAGVLALAPSMCGLA